MDLHILDNGIELTDVVQSGTVSVTSNNLKMLDWLYISVWRQNGDWYLMISQNGVDYVSTALTGYTVYGVSNFRFTASTSIGVEFFMRDLFISNARLYDATNISVNAHKYWIHSLDNFDDVAPVFVASPVFQQLTQGTITSANTEFALINTSVTNKSWTLYMDIKLPSVYNSQNPFKIIGTWSSPGNQTIDTWTASNKYFFHRTN